LQLKGTLIQKGMAFLEPATVVLLGGAQEQLGARQNEEFKNGLRERTMLASNYFKVGGLKEAFSIPAMAHSVYQV
jgi:hypothetical protein